MKKKVERSSNSWWLSGKESACNAGGTGPIPESGRAPGEGDGNSLQYSCLRNPMDGGDRQATVHGVTESDTPERVRAHTHTPP